MRQFSKINKEANVCVMKRECGIDGLLAGKQRAGNPGKCNIGNVMWRYDVEMHNRCTWSEYLLGKGKEDKMLQQVV